MKKLLFFVLISIFSFQFVKAQDNPEPPATPAEAADAVEAVADTVAPEPELTDWQKYWKLTGVVGLNVTQTSFVNWAAGGQDNANGVLFANLNLAYSKGLHSWEAHLITEIGMMYTMGAREVKNEADEVLGKTNWRKSSDKIDFSTKYGFEFQKTWFVTAMASFKSQFARGMDYAKFDKGEQECPKYISNWMTPGYADFSVGIDWKPKPFLSFYLSPVAGRITICTAPSIKNKNVMDYTVNTLRHSYGIDTTTGKAYKAEFGMTFKAQVNYTYENLTVLSSLVLFTPYHSRKVAQPFGNFDVDWDFSISYKFLKVLNVSLMTSLKYYDQVMITDKKGKTGPRVQFKEVLGVGVGYSF